MTAPLSIQQHTNTLYIRHKKSIQKANPWLLQFKAALLDELSNPQLSVTSLAFCLCISERQLYRRIKELTGMTPNLYIRQIRMEQAYLLLNTNTYNSLKTVAAAVGFRRVDYFSNLFEEAFGKRPKEMLGN